MDSCTTLDIIRDYYTKALQGSQFCRCCNIILGIYEYDILSYNASGIEFLEELKIKLKREKEESQKAEKLAGN